MANHKMIEGTKAQVWHGTAQRTSGGLKKNDLMQLKDGRIVSKKKHLAGKRTFKKMMNSTSFKNKWNAHKKV